MTNNNLNERLIEAIKNSLPEGENMAQVLMDILLIGKESVYRRLRGDVFFTFEEIAKVSDKLEFSIDNVVGSNSTTDKAVFDLNLLTPQSKIEDYSAKLEVYVKLFKRMRKSNGSAARFALNTLPYSFYLASYNLSKFKYYRWLYQTNTPMAHKPYENLIIPPSILELQKSFVAESQYIHKSLIILDKHVFSSTKSDIEYFYNLNLITKDDVEKLKEEMLELLNSLETIAISGAYKSGCEVSMYLSNVDLEASYCHFEYEDQQYSHLRLFSINGIDSQIPKICKKQKDWIDSLKRYSTLISQSGEAQRFEYFRKQRAEISNMIL